MLELVLWDIWAWTGAYAKLPDADHPHLAAARAELPLMAGGSFESAWVRPRFVAATRERSRRGLILGWNNRCGP